MFSKPGLHSAIYHDTLRESNHLERASAHEHVTGIPPQARCSKTHVGNEEGQVIESEASLPADRGPKPRDGNPKGKNDA